MNNIIKLTMKIVEKDVSVQIKNYIMFLVKENESIFDNKSNRGNIKGWLDDD